MIYQKSANLKDAIRTRRTLKEYSKDYSIYLILFSMVLILSVFSPAFLRPINLINVVRQISMIAVVAFGVTPVIITTGIDLSSGSVMAVSGIIAAILAQYGGHEFPLIISLVSALLVGMLAGAVNGWIVSFLKLPAFIATLGMMLAFRGIAYIISGGHPITNLSAQFTFIGDGNFLGIPVMILILIIVFLFSYILIKHTKFGKCIFAIGGNKQAAIVSGINVNKNLMWVYMYAGLMSAIAGIMLASRLSTGQPTAGLGYELDAISAAVIGGTSLSGGRGSIQGTLIGALIIGVLNNGMDLLRVPAYYQQVLSGGIIVFAVILDRARNK